MISGAPISKVFTPAAGLLAAIVLSILLFSADLQAEFYKYTNRDGEAVFVDDRSKIPSEYLDRVKIYSEKYDHLSVEERAVLLDRERQIEEERRALEIEREVKRKKEKERDAFETAVVIEGNKVLVPVVLGYKGTQTEVMLVLDTGASIIALHRAVADKLYIKEKDFKKAKLRVVGGTVIDTDIATLDSVKVGPHERKELIAGIIDHRGRSVSYSGLLGMNFLRGLEYSIDFKKQIIRWRR